MPVTWISAPDGNRAPDLLNFLGPRQDAEVTGERWLSIRTLAAFAGFLCKRGARNEGQVAVVGSCTLSVGRF